MGLNKEIEVLKKSQTEIKLEIKNKTNQPKISMESLLKSLNHIQGRLWVRWSKSRTSIIQSNKLMKRGQNT